MINKAELACLRSSVVAQSVKNPPAMQETRVQSLGREDALKEEIAAHSRILAWRIPGIEGAGEQHGDTGARHNRAINHHYHSSLKDEWPHENQEPQ